MKGNEDTMQEEARQIITTLVNGKAVELCVFAGLGDEHGTQFVTMQPDDIDGSLDRLRGTNDSSEPYYSALRAAYDDYCRTLTTR
jgi:hypothetical protein